MKWLYLGICTYIILGIIQFWKDRPIGKIVSLLQFITNFLLYCITGCLIFFYEILDNIKFKL